MFHRDQPMSGLAAHGSGEANGFGCPADGWCPHDPGSYGFAGIGDGGMAAGHGCQVTGATNGRTVTSRCRPKRPHATSCAAASLVFR
jgi:hypothetical protein